ncbi:unnamed protein product [Cyprideis torosa]|uniref:Uncharacterized protein n=1 Tax=Cyprideis torosa TaxID=163714 RepID=A0A7R8ZTQ0_9CRUS|nr:unnamed protein product [Cyprideis torosa]CAG0904547.1 unnamed protein product [Cyprideis torosa]
MQEIHSNQTVLILSFPFFHVFPRSLSAWKSRRPRESLHSLSLLEEELGMGEESIYEDEGSVTSMTFRDLSAWRVSIPTVEPRFDSTNGQRYFVFILDVRRVDVSEDSAGTPSHWTVERRYGEFYILDSKLQEFHGDLAAAKLPPKAVIGAKTLGFLQSKRQPLEQYLCALLENPHLRGSELVSAFLTPHVEFTGSFLPDLKLGKMIRGVPSLLRKEKGQNLQNFLASLTASCEAPKPKPSKPEISEAEEAQSVPTSALPRTLHLQPDFTGRKNDVTQVRGIYDLALWIVAKLIPESPPWLFSTLVALRPFLRRSLDALVRWQLSEVLTEALDPPGVEKLIYDIRDAIYEPSPPRTDQEKGERAQEALRFFREFLPQSLMHLVLGEESFQEGTKILFALLQNPKFNRQLAYMLIDQVCLEVFPEAFSESPSP